MWDGHPAFSRLRCDEDTGYGSDRNPAVIDASSLDGGPQAPMSLS